MKKIFVIISCLLLTACGAGRTTVIQDMADLEKVNYSKAKIIHTRDSVAVEEKLATIFAESMSKKFYQKGFFTEGNEGLLVEYRFIQFNAGNGFTRWLTGGIGNAGEGSLTVEVTFKSPEGNLLAKINVEGKIGSGFFGGSISLALDKAVDQASNYAVAKFK